MSKPKSRNILDKSKSDLDGWDLAISDAEKKIQESKTKIVELRKSIKVFIRLRDCNAPFPSDSEQRSDAKNDAAQ